MYQRKKDHIFYHTRGKYKTYYTMKIQQYFFSISRADSTRQQLTNQSKARPRVTLCDWWNKNIGPRYTKRNSSKIIWSSCYTE